eukprot:2474660-Ditylum_brightwellii.AAC.1
MDINVNPPLFTFGDCAMVFHCTAWYHAKILAIYYAFCFPPDKIHQYKICWKWAGWADQVINEEDTMHLVGGCQDRQTHLYHP